MRRNSRTYVVDTGADGDSESDDGTDGTADGSRVFGLDTNVGVSYAGGEEGGVGGVNERGGGAVEFSEEDKEEGEGGRLGEVGMGTNGALELGDIGGVVGLLLAGAVDLVRVGGSEVDVGVESVDDDVGREVRVVTGEERRVRERGLTIQNDRGNRGC